VIVFISVVGIQMLLNQWKKKLVEHIQVSRWAHTRTWQCFWNLLRGSFHNH